MRSLVLFFAVMATLARAQTAGGSLPGDSDRDGLSDGFEAALLERFEPRFYVSREDCSTKPARFKPGVAVPTVVDDDGTIYGQAFPGKGQAFSGKAHAVSGSSPVGQIELHYYHLWRTDCGRMGHALDAEHVAVLLRGEGEEAKKWKAVYWYAAAHEDTICDASQVTRASTIDAEDRGAKVWISAGKHASYLNQELCQHGCGGDRCESMEALHPARLINLGEAGALENGSLWVGSGRWPLLEKMTRSDFRPLLVGRVEALPDTEIAWAEPAKRPAQAAILGGNRAVDGAIVGGNEAGYGLSTGNRNTNSALSLAGTKTRKALGKSFRAVGDALGTSVHKTGEALGMEKEQDKGKP